MLEEMHKLKMVLMRTINNTKNNEATRELAREALYATREITRELNDPRSEEETINRLFKLLRPTKITTDFEGKTQKGITL